MAKGRTRGVVVLLSAITMSQLGASAAQAAEYPYEVVFTDTTSLTLEYGQFWSFPFRAEWASDYSTEELFDISVTGASGAYEPDIYSYDTDVMPNLYKLGAISTPYDVAPLAAGTYSFKIAGEWTDGFDVYKGETATPATLTIKPAVLGTELRIVADPANADSAIVTARFTGRFVDEYQSSFFPSAALSPAGVWHITITDEDGEVAIERSVERSVGDDVLATSFYWADAEPGVKYTASAEFVASGASTSNFTISTAPDFNFTGSEDARPTPSSTATGKPDTSLPEATEFGLPLWSIILIGVLIAALATLVTIFSVRLSRRPATSIGEVSA